MVAAAGSPFLLKALGEIASLAGGFIVTEYIKNEASSQEENAEIASAMRMLVRKSAKGDAFLSPDALQWARAAIAAARSSGVTETPAELANTYLAIYEAGVRDETVLRRAFSVIALKAKEYSDHSSASLVQLMIDGSSDSTRVVGKEKTQADIKKIAIGELGVSAGAAAISAVEVQEIIWL